MSVFSPNFSSMLLTFLFWPWTDFLPSFICLNPLWGCC
jgi:hypothetical protein